MKKIIAIMLILVVGLLILGGCTNYECTLDDDCTFFNNKCQSIDDLEGFHKLNDMGETCKCIENTCQQSTPSPEPEQDQQAGTDEIPVPPALPEE